MCAVVVGGGGWLGDEELRIVEVGCSHCKGLQLGGSESCSSRLGVLGCVWVCPGVPGCARVCPVCPGVSGCARVCPVCPGVPVVSRLGVSRSSSNIGPPIVTLLA